MERLVCLLVVGSVSTIAAWVMVEQQRTRKDPLAAVEKKLGIRSNSSDEDRLYAITNYLEAGKDPQVLKPFQSDSTSEIRSTVALALLAAGSTNPEVAIPLLVQDGNREVRWILDSLGPQSWKRVRPLVMEWAEAHDDLAEIARSALASRRDVDDLIGKLRGGMRSPEPRMRSRSCRALGDLGALANEATAELRACLNDEDYFVKAAAIEAAIATQNTEVIGELRKIVSAKEEENRVLAAIGLTALDPESTDGIRVLSKVIEQHDILEPVEVNAALKALAKAGPRAIEAETGLRSALTSKFSMTSYLAVELVVALDDQTPALLAKWLKIESGKIGIRTLELLARRTELQPDGIVRRIPSSANWAALLEPLTSWIKDDTEAESVLAMEALVNVSTKTTEQVSQECIDRILRYAGSKTVSTRVVAAEALRLRSCPGGLAKLREMAADSSPEVRLAACDSLWSLTGDSDLDLILPAIVRELGGSVSLQGSAALSLLSRIGPAASPASESVFRELDGTHARQAARTLVSIGPAVIPLAIRGLEADSPRIRSGCAAILADLPPSLESLEPLQGLLTDPECREHAVRAIANFSDRYPAKVRPILLGLVGEEWAVASVLTGLTEIGPDAAAVLPELERHVYEKRGRDFRGAYEYLSTSDFLNAKAVLSISLDRKRSVKGIEEILDAVSSGRSWVGSRFRDKPNTEVNREFYRTIDMISGLGDRGELLVPQLKSMANSHELLHPIYRFEAAWALARLQPTKVTWRRKLRQFASALGDFHGRHVADRFQQLLVPPPGE